MTAAALAIGGSDSCGGAGIQADLATFYNFGIRACSAVTALTAQTPESIARIEPVSLPQLEAEIRAAFSYYDIKVVKTGMLVDAARIRLIAKLLRELHSGKPVVIDPVMISSSGRRVLDEDALTVLTAELFPQASLITPNIPEAAALLGTTELADREAAGTELATQYSTAILLKGGHGEERELCDTLHAKGESTHYSHTRQNWNAEQRHGTGCRLASAIAAGLAQGETLQQATKKAIAWLQTQ